MLRGLMQMNAERKKCGPDATPARRLFNVASEEVVSVTDRGRVSAFHAAALSGAYEGRGNPDSPHSGTETEIQNTPTLAAGSTVLAVGRSFSRGKTLTEAADSLIERTMAKLRVTRSGPLQRAVDDLQLALGDALEMRLDADAKRIHEAMKVLAGCDHD